MPHPSIPLDDFRAHSFNREHGPRERVSRTFGFLSGCARKGHSEENERVERLSDGILIYASLYSCLVLSANAFCSRMFAGYPEFGLGRFGIMPQEERGQVAPMQGRGRLV
jgi:hypothetical protein